MNESTVERAFVKECGKQGVLAMKMVVPSQPGFPDVLITANNTLFLVEMKYVRPKDVNKRLRDLFTDSQPGFYMKWLQHSRGLFAVCRYERYIYLFTIDEDFIHDIIAGIFFQKMIDEHYAIVFRSMPNVVKYLRGLMRG